MEIKATIESFDDKLAQLRTEDGQSITWPANMLPKDIKAGQVLEISINDGGNRQEPEQLAKDLLNEILNTD
jgi:hypothetical protein